MMIDTPRSPAASSQTRLLGVATVLVALVALRMTRGVTMPIVAGALIAAMVWPMMQRFRRWIPRPMALLATVLVVVAVLLGLLALLGWSSARVGEAILDRRERLESLHRQASSFTSRFGVQLPDIDSPGSGAPPTGETAGATSIAKRIGLGLFSGLGTLGLTIGFMALALAEVDHARRKVHQRFAAPAAERITTITREVAQSVQRYLMVKSLTSAIAGAATALLTLAFGLDLALVWGLLAFLLEYVPTVGSILAVIPAALYAAIHFDGLARPLALTAALTVLQLFLGNYVDPKIEGRLLSLSPFVVLASIILWAWVWGAPGALLGVPLTIAVTTVSQHFEGTRWIWAMLTEPDGSDENSQQGRR